MSGMDRFLERHRNPLFPWLLGAFALLQLALGFHLSYFRPRALVAHAVESADAQIVEARAAQEQAVAALKGASWFRSSYLEGAVARLKSTRLILDEGDQSATSLIASAERGSWRERLALLRDAESSGRKACDLANEALAAVTTALRQKEEALHKRELVRSGIAQAEEQIAAIDQRGGMELPRYPTRYASELQHRRDRAITSLAHLMGAPEAYELHLPPEETIGGGDPVAALAILNEAVELTSRIQSSCAGLITWLDETAYGYDQADKQVQAADRAYDDAKSGLASRRGQTGYWLKAAQTILTEAESSRREGLLLLTAKEQGESVSDRPKAYLVGTKTIELCKGALANADAEIALAKSVVGLNSQLLARIDILVDLVPSCEGKLKVLKQHHNGKAWSGFADILERSGLSRADEHRSGHREVARLVGTTEQQFAQADKLVRRHLDGIDRQIADARRFIDHADDLERSREEYDRARRSANEVVKDNRSNVESYGSYDDSAERAFNKAEDALDNATRLAGLLLYADALASARDASNLSRGTGDRAYDAYKAAQRRRSHSSDDGFGFDFGSDSGSSGGGFDSGDSWGGGSDSDWSGGSDSDWGGGSDSDW